MFKKIALIPLTLCLFEACTTKPVPSTEPAATPAASPAPVVQSGKYLCDVVATTEHLRKDIGSIDLPAKLKSITESHYISQEDGWMGPAKSETDRAPDHIALSKAWLKQHFKLTDDQLAKVYAASYAKVWNGGDGAGPIGLGGMINVTGQSKLRPTLEAEIFQMNMLWPLENGPNGTIINPYGPKYPTKYLITYGSKHVVVSAGYEQGPPPKDAQIGMSVETFYFLGAPNQSSVYVGRLKDQSIPYGPVECQ